MFDRALSRAITGRTVRLVFLLLFPLTSILAACGGAAPTTTTTPTATSQSIPAVTIMAKDFSFAMPDSIQAGMVDVTLINAGAEPHHAQIARLNDGVTFEQFLAALKKGRTGGAALSMVKFAGGPDTVDPGKSQEVILNLTEGQYVAICFVSGKDNVPHFAKGMIKTFKVVGPSNQGQVSVPQTNGEVILKDFSFVLPDSIKTAGSTTLKVTNQGPQPHEMNLLKLAPGKTLKDVMAFFNKPSGPPPFADAGGMGAIAAGASALVKLNLDAGNYVALCFVPDPKTGKSHAELGMVTMFTVK